MNLVAYNPILSVMMIVTTIIDYFSVLTIALK